MSTDPNVKIHAWNDLKLYSADRVNHEPLLEDMASFLSNPDTVVLPTNFLPSGPVLVRPPVG